MDRIIPEHQEELGRLCAQYIVRRLEVFGSAATRQFDPSASDLDFLVEASRAVQKNWRNAISGFSRTWKSCSVEGSIW